MNGYKSKLKKPVAIACSLVGGGIVVASISIVAVLSTQKPSCACGDPASSAVGTAIYERILRCCVSGDLQ
ncbi:hypothetical protein [Acaryochloris thomasi]|uniref:hypothetical protein n=1 Tax=Acaryochloris thomasi TaxID=2929456 RepID=UPI0011B72FC9|nr:hypothetical protein [Acaryochloris thomasi]